ncbi:MAG: ABC transporter ATP-binding protein, partial [Methanoregulaceae archaeon]|nr:ABC transporter ATP-binding protein [Methanoregulaceae archaeon]
PNGSGKTTLFRCCLNLLRPSLGSIHVQGSDITTLKVKDLARKIAYVPQEHKPQFHYGVQDVVLMGRTPHLDSMFGIPDRDKRIALQALETLGISNLSGRSFRELSGGQRQLVLISRAVAQETPLMLLDEPTSSLDFANQVRIWNILRDIAQSGICILACTHDPNHVAWFCDRVIVMDKGTVVDEGIPSQVLTNDLLSQIYQMECRVNDIERVQMILPQDVFYRFNEGENRPERIQ